MPKVQEPSQAVAPPSKPSVPKMKNIRFSKRGKPPQETPPQANPPIVAATRPVPLPDKAAESPATPPTPTQLPTSRFTAKDDGNQVELDLNETSHFELIKGRVWAWSQGKPYETNWNSLSRVEMAFNHVLFLLIKRHVLLRPDAVLDMRPTFTGGAKARIGDDLELDVSRSAAPRLRELLGI
jgi:DNA-binding LytR/AlgR family response regulator